MAAVTEASLLEPALEEAVLPADQLVGDERRDEVEVGLRLVERLEAEALERRLLGVRSGSRTRQASATAP
jgi:hypothetical protein